MPFWILWALAVPVSEWLSKQKMILVSCWTLAGAIKKFEVDVASLAVYHLRDNQVQILAHLQGERVAEVKDSLKQKGYLVRE